MNNKQFLSQNKKAEMEFWSKFSDNAPDMNWLFYHLNQIKWEGLILDAGCGSGECSNHISKNINENIISLDLSINMLRFAQKKSLQCIQADLANLPFKNESFDTVIITGTLHHFPDINEVSGSIARSIKKGGHLVIAEPNITFLNKLSNIIGVLLRKKFFYEIRTQNEVLHNITDYFKAFCGHQISNFNISVIQNWPSLSEEIYFFAHSKKSILSLFILIRAFLRKFTSIFPSNTFNNNLIITAIKEV